MNADSPDSIDPYKIMFPIGVISALLGVSLWVLFGTRQLNFYPRAIHGNLMYFGFLGAFAAGFLMTAVPRMTGARRASWTEILLQFTCILAQWVVNLRNEVKTSGYIFIVQIMLLLIFILRRFLATRQIPFHGFIFLPVAFGYIIWGAVNYVSINSTVDVSFSRLCSEAFIMNLIIGIGSRLIPVLMRVGGSAQSPFDQKSTAKWRDTIIVLIALNLGYVGESLGYLQAAVLLRTGALTYCALRLLRIHRRPTQWSVVGIGLRAGVVALVLGQILSAATLDLGLAAAHVTYIGGFATITFMVATRVMVAHGGENLSYEITSRRLLIMLLILMSAVVLRFYSGANVSGRGMMWSSLCFISAALLWTHKFIKLSR